MTEHGGSTRVAICALGAILALTSAPPAHAQFAPPPTSFDNPFKIPDVRGVLPTAEDAEGVSVTLQILVLLTVLTLVPSILVLTTSFTRILVVLTLLRQAMATPQLPPGQVLLGLSLFMTILIMGPTWGRIHREAVEPYLNSKMSQRAAAEIGMAHIRNFMFRQIDRNDNHEEIFLFQEYATGKPVPDDQPLVLADVPTTALIPAFILSELKVAFVMGFRIYLPFLVIDMVIASILISMGMMMLPPVLISLPFKILLFVLADGWHLIIQTVLYSFDRMGAG